MLLVAVFAALPFGPAALPLPRFLTVLCSKAERCAPGRAGRSRPAVVLLDALGTLVELQPPAPRLRRLLAQRGFEVDEGRAAAAFRAEISYYLEHHLEGSDRERLDDLRDRCAAVMMEALDLPRLDHAGAREAMLAALEFIPFPDAGPALAAMSDHALVIVSNWDCSLADWLGPAGLLEHVRAVVTSAEAGVAKPGRGIFEQALELAGAAPAEAVHVGDSPDNDVAGARAAGIRPVLVVRDGSPPEGVEAVRSLAELPALL
ncbi:MAG: HAD-IA family hydrolase [Thermoleophilaceae bacterium]|nr:HAD-IA family hydrolase [Thermoleophilaceae bacterium]